MREFARGEAARMTAQHLSSPTRIRAHPAAWSHLSSSCATALRTAVSAGLA